MQTSKYHVGDIVQPYQCDGPYCIAKVRFDDIGNPIYTAIAEGQPYLLLRDTEIVRLINTATPDFVCEPHDNTGDITPDEANGAGWTVAALMTSRTITRTRRTIIATKARSKY